jgi:DNA polymerase III alpha subunit
MPGRTVIEWDKDDLDALGLLKVDILALGMLSCIRRAFDLLQLHYHRHLTLASVPPEDLATYDMLCKGQSGWRVSGGIARPDGDVAASATALFS